MLRNSSITEQLVASQEGLNSTELVICVHEAMCIRIIVIVTYILFLEELKSVQYAVSFQFAPQNLSEGYL
jgi:hypothetical protein